MIVIPKASRLEQLGAIVTAQLDGGSLRLFQNDYVPDANTLLADLTVATYSGYANKTIATWGDPFLDPAGLATSLAPLQEFEQTADTITNIIYGAYYLDSGGALVWAERFEDSVPMADATSRLNMVPKFQVGNLAPPV